MIRDGLILAFGLGALSAFWISAITHEMGWALAAVFSWATCELIRKLLPTVQA